MTHDELITELNHRLEIALYNGDSQSIHALRAVVELHKPVQSYMFEEEACSHCSSEEDRSEVLYPCSTIQAIEKELK